MTAGVYFFKIPNGFSTGGVSGIGTLLGRLTAVSPATWIAVLNLALLLVGFVFLGRSTGIRTVYCSLLFSGMTKLAEGEKTMLHTVCRRIEGVRLQRSIREIDPESFVIITNSSEIIGRGFRGV